MSLVTMFLAVPPTAAAPSCTPFQENSLNDLSSSWPMSVTIPIFRAGVALAVGLALAAVLVLGRGVGVGGGAPPPGAGTGAKTGPTVERPVNSPVPAPPNCPGGAPPRGSAGSGGA